MTILPGSRPVLLLSFAAASACAHTPKAAVPELELLTYNAAVEQFLTGVELRCGWELSNPTPSAARVEAVRWTLSITGEPDQQGLAEPGVDAAAGATAAGSLNVRGATAITDDAFAAREEATALTYSLAAVFTVQTASGPQPFEAEWSGELFPSRRPKVSVTPQAARYGGTVDLSFTLLVVNPNPFDLDPGALDYTIYAHDADVLHGTLGEGQRLGAGTETQFDLAKQLTAKGFAELVEKVKELPSVPYRVEVTLRVGDLAFPQTLAGDIQFAR